MNEDGEKGWPLLAVWSVVVSDGWVSLGCRWQWMSWVGVCLGSGWGWLFPNSWIVVLLQLWLWINVFLAIEAVGFVA